MNEEGPIVTTQEQALEVIRHEHINAEKNIRMLGFLLYLVAVGTFYGGVKILVNKPVAALIIMLLGIGVGWAGHWLRRLDRRGRIGYSVVAALGLAQILILGPTSMSWSFVVLNTVWWLASLAALWGPKASTVMTPHYRDVVILATLPVKRKITPLMVLLGVILLGTLVAGVAEG